MNSTVACLVTSTAVLTFLATSLYHRHFQKESNDTARLSAIVDHLGAKIRHEKLKRVKLEKKLIKLGGKTDKIFYVKPIGTVHSCFRDYRGTPRQGLFAMSSKQRIKLFNSVPSITLKQA